jgi:hypothetical protein
MQRNFEAKSYSTDEDEIWKLGMAGLFQSFARKSAGPALLWIIEDELRGGLPA